MPDHNEVTTAEQRQKRIEELKPQEGVHPDLWGYTDAYIAEIQAGRAKGNDHRWLLTFSRREQEHQEEVCDAWQEGWNLGYADAKRKDTDVASWPTPNPHEANHPPHAR